MTKEELLEARIASLEADNQRMRDSFQDVVNTQCHHIVTQMSYWERVGDKALELAVLESLSDDFSLQTTLKPEPTKEQIDEHVDHYIRLAQEHINEIPTDQVWVINQADKCEFIKKLITDRIEDNDHWIKNNKGWLEESRADFAIEFFQSEIDKSQAENEHCNQLLKEFNEST